MKNFNYMHHDYTHYLSSTEILGYIAGIISTLSFIPQVMKVWKGKATNGLSIEMYTLYMIGIFLWGIYAWLIDSHSLLITELITGLLVGYILVKIIQSSMFQ